MLKPKIVLFNGPPGCGKDTAVYAFNWTPNIHITRFSYPIKSAFLSNAQGAFIGHLNHRWDDLIFANPSAKDTVMDVFGITPRQWMIDFSEKFYKPLYGEDIFARLFIDRVKSFPFTVEEPVILVPDCGFQVEFDAVVKEFGADNCLLIRILTGYSFEDRNDSRRYIETNNNGVRTVDIYNNHRLVSKADFLSQVIGTYNKWRNAS